MFTSPLWLPSDAAGSNRMAPDSGLAADSALQLGHHSALCDDDDDDGKQTKAPPTYELTAKKERNRRLFPFKSRAQIIKANWTSHFIKLKILNCPPDWLRRPAERDSLFVFCCSKSANPQLRRPPHPNAHNPLFGGGSRLDFSIVRRLRCFVTMCVCVCVCDEDSM